MSSLCNCWKFYDMGMNIISVLSYLFLDGSHDNNFYLILLRFDEVMQVANY